jgi:hypothetical protein
MTDRCASPGGTPDVPPHDGSVRSGHAGRFARQERTSWNDSPMLRKAWGTLFGLEVP